MTICSRWRRRHRYFINTMDRRKKKRDFVQYVSSVHNIFFFRFFLLKGKCEIESQSPADAALQLGAQLSYTWFFRIFHIKIHFGVIFQELRPRLGNSKQTENAHLTSCASDSIWIMFPCMCTMAVGRDGLAVMPSTKWWSRRMVFFLSQSIRRCIDVVTCVLDRWIRVSENFIFEYCVNEVAAKWRNVKQRNRFIAHVNGMRRFTFDKTRRHSHCMKFIYTFLWQPSVCLFWQTNLYHTRPETRMQCASWLLRLNLFSVFRLCAQLIVASHHSRSGSLKTWCELKCIVVTYFVFDENKFSCWVVGRNSKLCTFFSALWFLFQNKTKEAFLVGIMASSFIKRYQQKMHR